MTHIDDLRASLDDVEARTARLHVLRRAWLGEQPSSFLSTRSATALDGRLSRLSVNWPGLVIRSRVDRLRVTGFRRAGADEADAGLWDLWRRAGLVSLSELVHTDRDLYGAAYVMVWGHATRPGVPVAVAGSPLTMGATLDPATGEVVRAVRRWDAANASHAVMYEPDAIRRYQLPSAGMPAAAAWNLVETVDNPWGVVPVVPFIRRASIDDTTGTSAVADILDLTDACSKTLQDAVVTSEYYARPRRWATGLELQFDEDGRAVDPFGDGRFLQAESPEAKFGQLDPPRLDSYADLLASITQQIGALTGLPPHYLGLHGDQPANADSIRAAETQLTSAAFSEQRQLDPSWSAVASMLHAVSTDTHPDDAGDIVPVWASPEVRTPAQAADAAAKLAGIGVPLGPLLTDPLGYDPQQAAQIAAAQRQGALDRAVEGIAQLVPRTVQ